MWVSMTRMHVNTSRTFIRLAKCAQFVVHVAMESMKQLLHNMARHDTMLHAGRYAAMLA